MKLSIAVFLYHLLAAAGTLLAVAIYYRGRSWASFWATSLALVAYTLLLALGLACIPFNPLRAARLLCYGWFLYGPIFLVAIAVTPRLPWLRTVAATLVCLIGAVAWYSFRVEPFRLEVTHYQVVSPRISQPLRIGVVADYQTDKLAEYEKRAWSLLMQERPDFILMPGDFLQANTRPKWERLRDETNAYLREIKFSAPLGVYAVGGNTDFRRRWPEIFANLPVHTLRDTNTIETEQFVVTGLSVEDSFSTQLSVPRYGSKLHIVLGHAPDFALSQAVDADLLVAGHTHGGQVCLPGIGPIVTFSQVPKSWAAGKTEIDAQRTLVVSRGVGMERRDAPRIRFLCRPQLVMIEVLPKR